MENPFLCRQSFKSCRHCTLYLRFLVILSLWKNVQQACCPVENTSYLYKTMRENLVESFLILSKKSILSWTQGGERKFQWFAKQYLHLSFYLVRRNPFTKMLFSIALGIKECQDWIHIKILYFSNSLHKWWKVTLTWTRISLKLSKFFGTDKFFSVPSNKAVQDSKAQWLRTIQSAK